MVEAHYKLSFKCTELSGTLWRGPGSVCPACARHSSCRDPQKSHAMQLSTDRLGFYRGPPFRHSFPVPSSWPRSAYEEKLTTPGAPLQP